MVKSPDGAAVPKWSVILAVIGGLAVVGTITVNALNGLGLFDKEQPRENIAQSAASGAVSGDLRALARGSLEKMTVHDRLAAAPDRPFLNPQGEEITLADFQGKVVVLNLWASWCAPCKIEMPTLAALAAAYEAQPDLVVLPVSVDTGDKATDEAKLFLADHAPLQFFHDPGFRFPFLFDGKGVMPQTILIDRQGRVRALMLGEADWAGPEARAVIDALLAEEG